MKIISVYNNTIHSDEDIAAACIANNTDLVFLLKNGAGGRFDYKNECWLSSFTFPCHSHYNNGRFNPNETSSIYTLDEIIVVVNDYKTHGFIHYPGHYNALQLYREDYHADITTYPIALFKDPQGIPHIIYSQAWNHVQIMNLQTRQILTAAKSLITEGAEENHLEFYKTHEDSNKLPWPRPYDYFYGGLSVSPDGKYFLSNGWVWGSFGCYNIYNVEEFIQNNRIREIHLPIMDHSDRAMCWVDNNTIAVTCHPYTEELDKDEDEKQEYAADHYEIQLFAVADNGVQLKKRIAVKDINIVPTEMRYDPKLEAFIIYGPELGIVVISMSGEVLLHDTNIKIDSYDVGTGLMLKTNGKEVAVYQLG
ncbi:MAG: hypothetical protein JO154_13130 [Chitinophaga sp.]|uniref:hypothetical protein n=1 Tax=Chitinophaga sp. TaxID=1869181 RepID=UPI0025C3EB82|nr:hypothetical protein [Chitinophaga sp.]MBV8253543.1 hypothetical protein [Chitinophaga sp.]